MSENKTINVKEIENLSFEDAMSKLQDLVKRLESGESSLDSAVDDYEFGVRLRSHCQTLLDQARMRVESIENNQTKPFDAGA